MGKEVPRPSYEEAGALTGGLGQAQVYSTVHVSPAWLGGWRRGPVGVTTEAGVCEDGGDGVGWGRWAKGREEEKEVCVGGEASAGFL